jgi:hypothetical protein
MKTAIVLFFATLLAACLDTPRSEVSDLCGDPPLISGIASFLAVIQDQPYICTTDVSDHQRALDVSLTRQWEQCMIEARSAAITLVAARRARNTAHMAVVTWMAAAKGTTARAEQSPGWTDYIRAEAAWTKAVAEIDSLDD